jgi:hypothetical protein
MKRKIIPPSLPDRFIAGLIPPSVFLLLWAIKLRGTFEIFVATILIVAQILAAYVFQDLPSPNPDTDEYTAVINQIGMIGNQLSELNVFLRRQRSRIEGTEDTIKKLNAEKTKLEPVVMTQKETVEAILAAHSERTARNAWKERLLGFFIGVVASVLASFIYNYFKI